MVINNFLKRIEKSEKIFGKKEIEIIKKQISGEKLTQSEKNRLSRDIRTKLKQIKDLCEFKDEFSLKWNQENQKLIEKAVKTIKSDILNHKIKAILLFGSFADKTFIWRSDIDICVIFDEINIKEATKFRIRISGQLPKKIDINVFNILPQKIKKEIAKNHKIVYENKFDNIDFTLQYLKDKDYFFRIKKIYGET